MPLLPSGRKVSLDFKPLCDLAMQAHAEQNAANLLLIEKPGQIFALVEVKEVEWNPGIPAEELDVVETPHGLQRCILRDTGYSVEDVLAACAPWSRGDISALRAFILTPRVRAKVEFYRRWLVSLRGKFTDQAIMWPAAKNLLPRPANSQSTQLSGFGL
jgi:hypothetical protein